MGSVRHSSGLSGNAFLKAKHLAQSACIADRVAANIVIEVEVRGRELRFPREQTISPLTQMSFGVIAAVACAASVKTNVGEVRSQSLRPEHFAPVVKAIGDIVAREQIVNLRNTPTLVAEFDGVAVAWWQDAEEV